MALQGRKPGWLLDKILGREAEPEDDAPALAPDRPIPIPLAPVSPPVAGLAHVAIAVTPEPAIEPMLEPPLFSPASSSEGQPNFTPAAEAPLLAAAEPSVTEASPDTPLAAKPVDELRGATPAADRRPGTARRQRCGGARARRAWRLVATPDGRHAPHLLGDRR